MKSSSIREKLDLFYGSFLPDLFDEPLKEETLATCHDCVMCKEKKYNPSSKCCTFYPILTNFHIGGLLLENSPSYKEGQKRVLEKISSRNQVTPFGLRPPALHTYIYNSHREAGFGKAQSWLCPYYQKESGMCTIWKYRNSICRTFFCKKVHGSKGDQFWDAMNQYLGHIEIAVAKYCIMQIDDQLLESALKVTQQSNFLNASELDSLPFSSLAYSDIWKSWENREAEFYKLCYEIVVNLKREEFESILGSEGRNRLLLTKRKYEAIYNSENLPKLLKRTPSLEPVNDPNSAIPKAMFDMVSFFDGKADTTMVLEIVREKLGVEVTAAQLNQMIQMNLIEVVKP